MKKQAQLGLVVEGKAASSVVLRLRTISQELGPVKSATLRVARRLSNMLHAGYAVGEYEELQAARLILLRVPDEAVPRVVEELCSAELVFRDLVFGLCESWLTAEVLAPLRERGAAVATFVCIPSVQRDWFVVEGQIPAVRQIRRFLDRNGMHSAEIHAGAKALLFGAELLTTVAPMPLLIAAQQALRSSGISGNPLCAVIEQMGQKMFQDFTKGARVTRGGPLAECSKETAETYLQELRRDHPQIAQVLDEQLGRAEGKRGRAYRPIDGKQG